MKAAIVHARQREGNERCLRKTLAALHESRVSARTFGRLWAAVHTLLQHVTAASEHTIDDVPASVVMEWLVPARGLSEFDSRVEALAFVRRCIENPALRGSPQEGSASMRVLRERLFWRRHHRSLAERTAEFFESITQEEILETEKRLEPFYEALHAIQPDLSGAGVFDESDEHIVTKLEGWGTKGGAVLDVGCGSGRLLKRIGARWPASELTGTSIFEFSISERATLDGLHIRPLYCTAAHVELADASQDVIVSSEVVEHLRRPEDLVNEVHRLLKPGGLFCITAPSKASYMYSPNPTTYLAAALASAWPGALPPFHNLYAPLTSLRLPHYGFDVAGFKRLFAARFPRVEVSTTRFTALKKFGLDAVAGSLPIFRWMGGLCVATGSKTSA